MKYIIVGFPCSGKQEIIEDLESNGVKVGKTFNNILDPIDGVYSCNAETFDNEEIGRIFENESYLYLREVNSFDFPYYDGLTTQSFDSAQVVALTPEQLTSIPFIPSKVCYVWLDNTSIERRARYNSQHRKHNFSVAEENSRAITSDFVEKVYSGEHNVLYFNNEDPKRVSAILISVLRHPDLTDLYLTAFK